jgi:uncharacterized protein (DUF1810 family)
VADADLVRFLDAQSDVYERVTKELIEGRKQTHWMWFVFPQLAGLGHSSMAQRYAIRDLDQARRYQAHPTLGSRLRHDVRLMASHKGKSALEILGSPDDLKFRSCLTLFASLIGRSGSSAFRLSTTTVSMSLAGSCFSSESAPRPFQHGIRRRGGTI